MTPTDSPLIQTSERESRSETNLARIIVQEQSKVTSASAMSTHRRIWKQTEGSTSQTPPSSNDKDQRLAQQLHPAPAAERRDADARVYDRIDYAEMPWRARYRDLVRGGEEIGIVSKGGLCGGPIEFPPDSSPVFFSFLHDVGRWSGPGNGGSAGGAMTSVVCLFPAVLCPKAWNSKGSHHDGSNDDDIMGPMARSNGVPGECQTQYSQSPIRKQRIHGPPVLITWKFSKIKGRSLA
ncbi:uncharacterized protein N7459_009435 [Penicillium hispanicum]|uniref:uncharacterized protein n=1 Tax=Penicillium hispanicum TaxID=1080232 RepID=UPI0025417750|nr:uncharacterized protein N7459_009435 [Penicillium hispanicum]KAJ5570005.1 hypothetical protein N7459_009435 [Penicillium hispanicum]